MSTEKSITSRREITPSFFDAKITMAKNYIFQNFKKWKSICIIF